MSATATAVPAPAAPAGRPSSAFDDVIDIASRLTALMERENACLAKFDVKGVAALHEEKLALTRAYSHRVHEIKKDPAKLKAIAQAVRDEMKAVMAKFDEAARLNEQVLRAAKDANDRVLKAVIDAANAQAPRVQAYSRSGAMTSSYSARAHVPPPLSVNRAI